MINESVVVRLRKRYHSVHPLVFQRSLERARNSGDLFDILDSIPEFPIIWDEKIHRWITTNDITQLSQYDEDLEEEEEEE